jgi:hypothetical protein
VRTSWSGPRRADRTRADPGISHALAHRLKTLVKDALIKVTSVAGRVDTSRSGK